MKDNNNKFEIIFTISTGLLVLYALTNHKHLPNVSQYLLFGIIGFNILTLFVKPVSLFCTKAWMQLSKILSIISSGILLSIIYYIFLTPIALLYRIFNENKIKTRRGKSYKTMFKERNYSYTAKDLDYTW